MSLGMAGHRQRVRSRLIEAGRDPAHGRIVPLGPALKRRLLRALG
jgi:hypothetical protein